MATFMPSPCADSSPFPSPRRFRVTALGIIAVVVVATTTVSSSPVPSSPVASADTPTSSVSGGTTEPVRYFDPMPVRPRGVNAIAANAARQGSVPSGVDVKALSSRPGAERTIYLDFTGGIVKAGSIWSYSEDIPYPPYTADGDSSTAFSAPEELNIFHTWETVVEDFAPFNVNVTTIDPGTDAIRRTGDTDPQFGVHAIITQGSTPAHEKTCKSTCGGVAILGAVGYNLPAPVWTFAPTWGTGIGTGNTTSHEIGHALGLLHDGTTNGDTYYSGSTSWGPIMGGVMSNAVLAHWSPGDYPEANNQEDDLSMMGSWLPVLADDQPAGSPATPVQGAVEGVINDRTDSDAFTFIAAGKVTVSVVPSGSAPNLDSLLSVFTAEGQPVARIDTAQQNFSTDAPHDHLNSYYYGHVDRPTSLVAVVEGTGATRPGYSYTDYNSIGRYTISVEPGPSAPRWRKEIWKKQPRAKRWWNARWRLTGSEGPLTITRVGAKPRGVEWKVSEDGRTVRLSGIPHKAGTYRMRLVATDMWGDKTSRKVKLKVGNYADPLRKQDKNRTSRGHR